MGASPPSSPSYNDLTSFIAKIDQNFNTSNILTGRYFFGDSIQSFPLALAAAGGQLPGFNTFTPTRVQLASLSYVHISEPTRSTNCATAGTALRRDFSLTIRPSIPVKSGSVPQPQRPVRTVVTERRLTTRACRSSL